jgi:hypothetical protein
MIDQFCIKIVIVNCILYCKLLSIFLEIYFMTGCFLCYFIIKTISTSTSECTADGIYGMLNKWNEMHIKYSSASLSVNEPLFSEYFNFFLFFYSLTVLTGQRTGRQFGAPFPAGIWNIFFFYLLRNKISVRFALLCFTQQKISNPKP